MKGKKEQKCGHVSEIWGQSKESWALSSSSHGEEEKRKTWIWFLQIKDLPFLSNSSFLPIPLHLPTTPTISLINLKIFNTIFYFWLLNSLIKTITYIIFTHNSCSKNDENRKNSLRENILAYYWQKKVFFTNKSIYMLKIKLKWTKSKKINEKYKVPEMSLRYKKKKKETNVSNIVWKFEAELFRL